MTEPCHINALRHVAQLGHGRVSFLEWPNAGPTALLCHGITSSAVTMWRLGEDLAAEGWRVIAIDMPGHGQSDLSPAYDIDTVAGIVGDLIVTLGLSDVVMVGHSWGGATTLALLSRDHPARAAVQRAVLIDPLIRQEAAVAPSWLPQFSRGVGEPPEATLPMLRETNPDWHPCDYHWKAQALAECRYEQVAGLFLIPDDWTLAPRIGQVQVPLLILLAEPAYTIVPPAVQAELRAAAPPGLVWMQLIPGTNHNMLRGPGYGPTYAAIRAFLIAPLS
ncbi:alpha/beta fold hydrolase [uncultured Chloroflexus sp.]|uniref:alpha/beta fold hydrolase n=1 Tax=uncultured Chloroflexus sp. TaxID=214040 RepID=UPI002620631B|nr:alpha/beta fold hydrolase [uncultured Chloroflexus sp.]